MLYIYMYSSLCKCAYMNVHDYSGNTIEPGGVLISRVEKYTHIEKNIVSEIKDICIP